MRRSASIAGRLKYQNPIVVDSNAPQSYFAKLLSEEPVERLSDKWFQLTGDLFRVKPADRKPTDLSDKVVATLKFKPGENKPISMLFNAELKDKLDLQIIRGTSVTIVRKLKLTSNAAWVQLDDCEPLSPNLGTDLEPSL